jgi:hypothetical protein
MTKGDQRCISTLILSIGITEIGGDEGGIRLIFVNKFQLKMHQPT